MLVLYYFQSEYGESIDNPNAFMLPDGDVSFGQFLDAFPYPVNKANLRFRFRMEDQEHDYLWLDVNSRTEVLPVHDHVIFAKILRLDSLQQAKRKIFLRRKVAEEGHAGADPIPAPKAKTSSPTPAPTPVPSRAMDSASAKQPVPTAASAGGSVRSKPPSVPAPQAQAKSLLDDDEPASPGPVLSGKYSAPSAPSGPASGGGAMDIDEGPRRAASPVPSQPAVSREELAARKDEAISGKVKAALDEKKERDNKAEAEQDAFAVARAKYDAPLLQWATNNKEKRNVRTLLTTMHTVLPTPSKWKTLSLGDVLQASDVKKAYRKAMLVVHPDHTLALDSEGKFICKRVFEALNEAYEEFGKKENP